MDRITLYSMPSSANSYKVRLLLALLGRDYAHLPCEANSAELRAARGSGALPLGTLPALHLPGGDILSESGAILWYLGEGTDWVPTDRPGRARSLAWMFFEQNRHEPVIAVRTALLTYPHRAAEATPERLADLLARGHDVLARMEDGLAEAPFFGGGRASVADIALYGYTHAAGSRGGFDMARFPRIGAWCRRIAALPGHLAPEELT